MENTAKKAEPRARRQPSSAMLSIRVPNPARAKIDFAAEALGKTRTDYILDTMVEKSDQVILDRRVFALNEADSAKLKELLENPPRPVEALRKLMASKAPWE